MEIIDNRYYIFSSNASFKSGQMGSVTVKDGAGEIIARIFTTKSQPLKHLRRWPLSPERHQLVDALLAKGVEPEIVSKIVSM